MPQDGRIKSTGRGKAIDLRVSTMPTMLGESVVLRILDRSSVELDFAALGFRGAAHEAFRRLHGRSLGKRGVRPAPAERDALLDEEKARQRPGGDDAREKLAGYWVTVTVSWSEGVLRPRSLGLKTLKLAVVP